MTNSGPITIALALRYWKEEQMADAALNVIVSQGTELLQLDREGVALLRDRLRAANTQNMAFPMQFKRLLDLLHMIARRLETAFPNTTDRILATGDWARHGVDLRNLPLEDIVLLIVLALPERPFALYLRIAETIFSHLNDDEIRLQFQLVTATEWHAMVEAAQRRGVVEDLGIPLFARA